MNLQNIFLILRARIRLALSIFFCVVSLAILVTILQSKQYTATASILVDAKPDPITGSTGMAELALATYVTTQGDVIASERVGQRVVKVLKLDEDPFFMKNWFKSTGGKGDISIWIADQLINKRLAVTSGHASSTRSSNVIDIAVKWPDPLMAAKLANTFAQVAIDTNIELKVEPAKQYSAWFVQRSRALHTELEGKQKELSDFQSASGITTTDAKLDVENDRLTQLSAALVAIQGQRQDSQSRLRQASDGNNDSLPEVLQSPSIGALKNELSEAQAKETDVAGRLGKNHPDYQSAVAEVASIRARIQSETDKIAASLGSTAQVNLRREAELRQAMEAQRKRVLELKHQHDEASVLENDVLAVQRDLDAVNQRLAQSNLESQTQQTNVVLLSSASVPVEPSSPKTLLNLALGIFLGFGLGVASALLLEVLDPRVRDPNELAELLGVPMLTNIDYIKPPQAAATAAAATGGRAGRAAATLGASAI